MELAFTLQFALRSNQIAVPNFVPCVPEFVSYPDINSCDSVVMGRMIG
jgi:hypothetical protein